MMKKIISISLALLFVLGAFASCAKAGTEDTYTITSSSASAEAFLRERAGDELFGKITVVAGEGSSEYGVDLTALNDDGYCIKRSGTETVILAKNDGGLDRAVRYFVNNFPKAGDAEYVYGEGCRVKRLTVAGHDISEYEIYIPTDADELTVFAASELSKYIGKACGTYPAVCRDLSDAKTISIRQITADDPLYETLGNEGFNIKVASDGNVTITGGLYRGTIYGVYEFLEKFVGWRFLYDYDSTVAVYSAKAKSPVYKSYNDAVIDYLYESDHVDVPAGTDVTEVPSFALRSGVGDPGTESTSQEAHTLKMKADLNDVNSIKNVRRYNGYGIPNEGHHGLVRIGLGAALPNYPGYEESRGDGQTSVPCFTDPDNVEAAIEFVEALIRSRQAAGQVIGRELMDVDISQPDAMNFCSCKMCTALVRREEAQVAPVVYFTNAVADAVAEDISPDVNIIMFAYGYATKPPKTMKPSPNVSVSYCFYVDVEKVVCMRHPYNGSECTGTDAVVRNDGYAAEFRRWCELCDKVTVWYYPGTWSAVPLTSVTYKNVREDIKFFHDCGAIGVFVCPDYSLPDDGILPYLVFRAFWNAEMTEEEFDELVLEYYRILYGDAWEIMYEITESVYDAASDDCWSTFGASDPSMRVNMQWFMDNAEWLYALRDKAISLASSDIEEYRIRYRLLSTFYTCLALTYREKFVNGTDAEKETYLARWNEFVTDTETMPIRHNNKYADFKSFDINVANPIEFSDSYTRWFE